MIGGKTEEMKKLLRVNALFIVLLLIAASSSYAKTAGGGLQVEGLSYGVRQGDVALVTVRAPSDLDYMTGKFEGKKLLFHRDGETEFTTLLGIDMDLTPGEYELSLTGKGIDMMVMKTVTFNVMERDYDIERLRLPKKMVSPGEKLLKRIRKENLVLHKVKKIITGKRYWDGEFIAPVDGRLADNFGARRILNGVAKKPHSGNDIRAQAGTEISSPNDGRVVYAGNMYYGGKTVIINHGHGLSTLYMHLSRVFVKYGEKVSKGDVIGLVGSTGRSTGPHLHWGAYLNGIKVDPASLLSLEVGRKGDGKGMAGRGSDLQERLGGD